MSKQFPKLAEAIEEATREFLKNGLDPAIDDYEFGRLSVGASTPPTQISLAGRHLAWRKRSWKRDEQKKRAFSEQQQQKREEMEMSENGGERTSTS